MNEVELLKPVAFLLSGRGYRFRSLVRQAKTRKNDGGSLMNRWSLNHKLANTQSEWLWSRF